jgi:membrane-associated phospholipid phosphatase
MKRSILFLLGFLCLLLPACNRGGGGGGGNDADDLKFDASNPNAVEPTAGEWRTWLLADGAAVRPPAPPKPSADRTKQELSELRTLTSQRTPAHEAAIDYWNAGAAKRWNEIQRQLIIDERPNPPRASRGLAYVSVAMYDAMVAAWDAKYRYLRARPSQYQNPPSVYGPEPVSPSYVSERAAISAAAADVLKYLFPPRAADIDVKLAEALDADLYSGIHFRSDVEEGEEIGHAVATLVLDRAANDHSDDPYTGTRLMGPGYWVPTPPGNIMNPLEPQWGGLTTWLLTSGRELRPPAPPVFGTPEFDSQVSEVWLVNQSLTPERLAIAQFWADGPGTVTPPGHWNQIGVDLAYSHGWTDCRVARMLALLGVAQMDAFIACWDGKFFWWTVRPVTVIRDRYNPGWLPPIATPPFPSYASGHSTTSGAAAVLLAHLLPEHGVSLIQMGIEAMNSRLYGGIHYSFDNLTGFNVGSIIGVRAIQIALTDGAPPSE